uniref:glutathione transferase n=1 Tax=Phallusia mammillata TaxID=59560 RepID=A0A6F9DLB5_9ASCI|nr:glutathione S-transferase 1 [Phallusia mammillata]
MPTYKLCYFDIRGLGEMIRLMFKDAGVEFEDCRVNFNDWTPIKPTMPFGKMPVLFVDGKPLAHSRAIVRYLARELNYSGQNSFETGEIDVWFETLFELFDKLPWSENDETKKAELIIKFMKEEAGPKFEKLEAQIKANGGPYVMGKNATFVDFAMLGLADLFLSKFKIALDDYPGVMKQLKAMRERPNVAAWIAKRPSSDF